VSTSSIPSSPAAARRRPRISRIEEWWGCDHVFRDGSQTFGTFQCVQARDSDLGQLATDPLGRIEAAYGRERRLAEDHVPATLLTELAGRAPHVQNIVHRLEGQPEIQPEPAEDSQDRRFCARRKATHHGRGGDEPGRLARMDLLQLPPGNRVSLGSEVE
jgi:hypothetical protein